MDKKKKLLIIIIINILIFVITNIAFSLKYEQVDDMIIYTLYSNLDGTSSVYGIYFHPILCFVLSLFFSLIPQINWHTIFLLICQFISFTIIGYIFVKRKDNNISFVIYTLFASVFYTSVLLLIQYTSVAGLLIATSLLMFMDIFEHDEKRSIKYKIIMFALFVLGIMIRVKSIEIILPFIGFYFVYKLLKFIRKKVKKEEIISMLKYCVIFIIIFLVLQAIYWLVYNLNPIYKEYFEYNDIRTKLTDMAELNYKKDKQVLDEINWSKKDYLMLRTFDFGDTNIYSKENLQKVLDFKKSINEDLHLNLDVLDVMVSFLDDITNNYRLLFLFATLVYLYGLINNAKKFGMNTFILLATYCTHLLFIVIERSLYRVVIPVYVTRNNANDVQHGI